MKIDGSLAACGPVDPAVPESEERTRDRVCREVLQNGPVTAAQLAAALSLTPAAVRRHLDVLTDKGLVATHEVPVLHRGRGRPARRFVLTPAGHAAMSSAYDDLAAAALAFLADVAGEDAVRRFAEARVADLETRYGAAVGAAGQSPTHRAEALAAALTADGYAASTRSLTVGARHIGIQLCQGHCPVQRVAAQFPQFCEAETEAFSRLLGAHVQRLATLAHGEHVCTTLVPDLPSLSTPQSTPQPTRPSTSPSTSRPQERTHP